MQIGSNIKLEGHHIIRKKGTNFILEKGHFEEKLEAHGPGSYAYACWTYASR